MERRLTVGNQRRRISDKDLHRHENQIGILNSAIRALVRAIPLINNPYAASDVRYAKDQIEKAKRNRIDEMNDDKDNGK